MPRLQPSSMSFEELLRQREQAEAQRRKQEEATTRQLQKRDEDDDEQYDDEEDEELEEESIPSQEEEEDDSNKLPFDIAEQRAIRAAERSRQHEEWVAKHANETRFDHEASKTRAQILIAEARRNELNHLQHQLRRAKYLLRKHREAQGLDASPCASPQKGERVCSCCVAPASKQLTAKYRAMVILRDRFGSEHLDEAVETLRQTYNSDHEMLEDLTARYGQEPHNIDDIDPELRVRNVKERLETCDARWKEIGRSAMRDMQYRDNFPTVIRNLSIMRIFLEGSQASQYGCDVSERSRRDAHHQAVLDRLSRQGALFETPEKKPETPAATPAKHGGRGEYDASTSSSSSALSFLGSSSALHRVNHNSGGLSSLSYLKKGGLGGSVGAVSGSNEQQQQHFATPRKVLSAPPVVAGGPFRPSFGYSQRK